MLSRKTTLKSLAKEGHDGNANERVTASESMIIIRSMAMRNTDDYVVPIEKLKPRMAVKIKANMLIKINTSAQSNGEKTSRSTALLI